MTEAGAHVLDIPGDDPDHAADTASARAARWLTYLYSGHATEQGRQHFSAWLRESDAHARAYHALEQWWRDVDHVAATDVEPADAEYDPSAAGEDNEPEVRGGLRRYAVPAIAAALLAVIGIGIQSRVMAPAKVTETRHASRIGEIREIVFEDGTRLTLGSGSVVTTRLSEDERGAELVDGQVYFDVARDTARPFLVDAGKTQVRVLGTEFEMLKGAQGVRVSVAKGLVGVGRADARPGGVRLRAGQQVSASPDGTLGEARSFDEARALVWRTGRLEYVSARVAEIVADVNRYRTAKISLGDKRVGAMTITIAMPIDETDRLLSALEATGEVRLTRKGNGVILTAR